MRAQLTKHAIARYRERVRPTLGEAQAKTELAALVNTAPESLVRSLPWGHPEEKGTRFCELSDGIAIALRGGVVTTVLTRASHSDEVRAARNRRKASRRRAKRKNPASRYSKIETKKKRRLRAETPSEGG